MSNTQKNYHLTAIIERKDNRYIAYCPQLPMGGHVDGENFEEVMELLKSAAGITIKEMSEAGEKIPQSESDAVTFIEVTI